MGVNSEHTVKDVFVAHRPRSVKRLFFIFPKPKMVADYYRELTVKEGERLLPFSAEDFAAFRARHRGHIVFEQQ